MKEVAYNAYVNQQAQEPEEEREFYEWLDALRAGEVTRAEIEEVAWKLAAKAEKRAFDAGFDAGRASVILSFARRLCKLA